MIENFINMPVILYLGKYAFRALKDYEQQLKAGGEIVFRKKDIDLPHRKLYSCIAGKRMIKYYKYNDDFLYL